MNEKIKKRLNKNKILLLEQLQKIPIIHVACDKTSISRATYYRWRKEDMEFANNADTALEEGKKLINDMAESQLISLIKDKHPTGIIFWLKHNHPTYANRLEITGGSPQEKLSEEEINNLAGLLYNQETFRQGQELLTSYIIKGKISDRFAQLFVRIFMSRIRAEDVFTRKAEADVMTEVMLRKDKAKKRYGK